MYYSPVKYRQSSPADGIRKKSSWPVWRAILHTLGDVNAHAYGVAANRGFRELALGAKNDRGRIDYEAPPACQPTKGPYFFGFFFLSEHPHVPHMVQPP